MDSQEIIGHGTDNHNGSYKRTMLTKTGCAIIKMKRHIKPTKLLAEYYLQNKITKANHTLATDRLNELMEKKQYKQRQCQKHNCNDNELCM